MLNPPDIGIGESITVNLTLAPQRRITPPGTTFTVLPTVSSVDAVPVTASTGVTNTVTGSFVGDGDKKGPSEAVPGETVTYDLSYTCFPSDAYASSVTIVDTLPEGISYVSSSPVGVYDAGTHTVTWTISGDALENFCDHEVTDGTDRYVTLTARVDDDFDFGGEPSRSIANNAEITFDPVTGEPPQTISVQAWTTIIDPGAYPPGTITKFAAPRAHAGTAVPYQIRLNAANALTAALVEPLPCRGAGTVHESPASPSTCDDAVYHPTSVGVSGIPAAGCTPQIRVVGGAIVDLEPASAAGFQRFAIPSNVVGQVIEVILPGGLEVPVNGSITIQIDGTVDADLAVGDVVRNTATATFASPLGDQPPVSSSNATTIIGGVLLTPSKMIEEITGPYLDPYTVLQRVTATTDGPFESDIVLADLMPATQSPVTVPSSVTVNGVAVSVAAEVSDNYQGTGRHMIRFTVPAAALNTAYAASGGGRQDIEIGAEFTAISAVPTTPGTPPENTLRVSYDGTLTGCTYLAETPAGDDGDWNGDGLTTDPNCRSTTPIIRYATPTTAGIQITKTGRGDLDGSFVTPPRIANVSADGGFVDFSVTIANIGADPLADLVVYDVLPHLGDGRGSAFTPIFESIETLPAGLTVEYSASTTPCQPEIGIASSCVDDWSDTMPATVAALRFRAAGPVASETSFEVTYRMMTPMGLPSNGIAWNSATGTATRPGDVTLLPVTADAAGAAADAAALAVDKSGPATAAPGDEISYSVTVTNAGSVPLDDVDVFDDLPIDLDAVAASDGGVVSGSTITWNIATLAVGESVTFTVTATINLGADGTTITNRVTAASTTPLATPVIASPA